MLYANIIFGLYQKVWKSIIIAYWRVFLYINDLRWDKVGLMWMKPVVDYMTGEDYTHCYYLYSQDIT